MTVVYAITTARVGHTQVVRGTVWPADDPVVRSHPSLFSSDPRPVLHSSEPRDWTADSPPVEEMTAEPGRKRATTARPAETAG